MWENSFLISHHLSETRNTQESSSSFIWEMEYLFWLLHLASIKVFFQRIYFSFIKHRDISGIINVEGFCFIHWQFLGIEGAGAREN